MTDVASITLRVDTGDLQRGNNELDKFQKAAVGAAGAADGFSASGKDTAKTSKELAQSVDETHRRVAEFAARLREAQTTTSATGKAQDQLTESYFRQIDRIKQLGTGTQELQAVQNQIRAARAAGNITQDNYLTLTSAAAGKMRELTRAEETSAAAKSIFIQKLKDQVTTQSLSREELLRYRAAQLGAGSAADVYIKKLTAAGEATRSLGLKSAAARREIGVLIGELARGNFGALRGSGITLANRAGWIDQLLTLRGLGIAGVVSVIAGAVIGLGKAWYEGSQEATEFNKQLILTGNYSGKTAGQLQALAQSLAANGVTQHAAADALAKVLGSGSFSGDAVTMIADTAARLNTSVGQSVDETIKQFKGLQSEPVQAVTELDKSLHFLTATQLEQITSLADQGRATDAAKIAMESYATAMRDRAGDIRENLGDLEKAWRWVSEAAAGAWDSMLNVGRETPLNVKLESTRQELERAQRDLTTLQTNGAVNTTGYGYGRPNDSLSSQQNILHLQQQTALVARLKKEYDSLGAQSTLEGLEAGRKKAEQDEQTRLKRQFQADQDLKKQYETAEEKHQRELTRIRNSAASKSVKDEAIERENARYAKSSARGEKKPRAYVTPAGDRADDSAQAEVLALQTQLQVLKQHSGINDKISQQRRDLWKAQAQYSVLETAAGQRQLQAQEKSLLSTKDSVLAQKEKLASLGDEVLQQERLNKLQDASAKYVIQMSEKRQALHDSAELSDRESQRRMAEAQLAQGWQNQGGSLEDNGYKNQLRAARDYYAEEDRMRADWSGGVKKGWAEYLDSATNVYSSIQNVAQSALGGISDMMTNLVTTGTASFKQFSVSILKMIVEIINKLLVAYAVQTAMGWVSGSQTFSSTGLNDGTHGIPMPPKLNQAWSGGYIPEFAKGGAVGYTGDGGKYEPKGIVHGGEFVFTKEATSSLGIGNLYALMKNATSGNGYADGGYVGKAPMYGLSNRNVNSSSAPQVNITINQNGQTQTNSSAGFENFGKEIGAFVDQRYRSNIQRDLGQQGAISAFVMGKMGRR